MKRATQALGIGLVLVIGVWTTAQAQETPWALSWGNAGSEQGWHVAPDGAGGVYVTGSFRQTVDFDPGAGLAQVVSQGDQDVYLARYTRTGTLAFVHGLGGAQNDVGLALAPDGTGGVWLTGYFQDTADFDPGAGTALLTSAGGTDVFLARFDSTGALLSAGSMGGPGADLAQAAAPDGTGGVYLTGSFRADADFDPTAGTTTLVNQGLRDVFLARYNASGGLVYAQAVGGSDYDEGYGVASDGAGGVYVTGSFRGTVDFDPGAGITNHTSAGVEDAFIARYSSTGTLLYAQALAGTLWGYGAGVTPDGTGGVYVAGSFRGTVDFDPGAGTALKTGAGYEDVFLAHYDGTGALVAAHAFGAEGLDRGVGVAPDAAGGMYLTGFFSNTVDFDPGAGSSMQVAMGGTDGFVSRFDAAGAWTSAFTFGAAQSDEPGGLAPDGLGGVFVTGSFRETVDFDPGAGVATRTSNGAGDAFLVSYADHVAVDVTILLQGAFDDPGLYAGLTAHLPLDQPYGDAPFAGTPLAYAGTEHLAAVPAGMVDWVLVELRSGTAAGTRVATQAALLGTDGRIVAADGASPVRFSGVPKGGYHLVVRHRNHLSVLSASPQPLGVTAVGYDFSSGAAQAFGVNATVELAPGVYGLWGGDGTVNGQVTASDFLSVWLPANGGSPGYMQADFDMNSSVTAFDFLNVWLPANGRNSQVPE